MRLSSTTPLLACLALLAACGGGGGSDAPAVPSPTPVATLPPAPAPASPAPGEPVPEPASPAQPAPAPVPPANPPTTAAPPLVIPGTWTVLGSSTAAGIGASTLQSSWVVALAQQLAPTSPQVVNLAVSGLTTYGALPSNTPQRPDRPAPVPTANIDAALAYQPRLVLLGFPTNDIYRGYPIEESVANLQRIRQAALDRGSAVIALSSQPRSPLSDAQRALLPDYDAQLAEAFGECLVPVREILSDTEGRLLPVYDAGDGVHLSDAGHAVVRDRVREVLASGKCVRLG